MNVGSLQIDIIANLARLQSDMDKVNKSVDTAMRNVDKSVGIAKNAFASLTGAIGIGAIVRLADEYKKFDSQLKLATKTTKEYEQAYSRVLGIARTSQSEIGAIGTLYARLTNNLKEFGISQKDIGNITESVALSLRVSNATAQETSSVMLQLSQAFGAGRLNGQEFNAMAEGAPILLRQLAKSLNVTYGELKAMGAEGKLTAQALQTAFTDPAYLAGLQEQVKSVGTISSAMTVFTNNLKVFIGEADKASGAGQALAKTIIFLGDNLNALANIGFALLIGKIAQSVAAIRTKIVAQQAERQQIILTSIAEQEAAAKSAADTARVLGLQQLKLTAKVRMAEANVAEANSSLQVAAGTAREASALQVLEAATYKAVIAKGQLAKINGAVGVSLANNASATTLLAAQTSSLDSATKKAASSIGIKATALKGLSGAFSLLGGTLGVTTIALTGFYFWIEKVLNDKKIEQYGSAIDGIRERAKQLQKQLSQGISSDNAFGAELSNIKDLEKARDGLFTKLKAQESLKRSDSFLFNEKDFKQTAIEYAQATKDIENAQKELAFNVEAYNDKIKNSNKSALGALPDSVKLLSVQVKEQKDIMAIAKAQLDANAISQSDYNRVIADAQKKIDDLNGVTKLNKSVTKDAAEAIKEYNDALAESVKLNQAQIDIINQQVANYEQEYASIMRNIDVMNSSEESVSLLEIARLNDAIAAGKQGLEYAKLNGATQEQIKFTEDAINELEKLAKARQDLLGAKSQEQSLKDEKEASKTRMEFLQKEANENFKLSQDTYNKQAKEYEQIFDRASDNLSRSLTDGIIRGFENGKSFIKNFKDTIVNAFKGFFVNIGVNFIQSALGGVTGNIGKSIIGALGLGGSGSAFAGLGEGASGILDQAKGIFDIVTKGFDGANAALQGSVEAFGSFLTNGSGGILDSLGGAIGQFSGAISTALPFASSILKAFSGDFKGAAGSALGAALSFTPLGPVGGLIGSFIGGSLFGGKKQPPRTVTELPDVGTAFSESLSTLLKGFGMAGDVSTSARYSGRGGGSGYGFLDTTFDGQTQKEAIRYKDAYGEESMQEFINTALGSYLVKAIQSTSLTKGIKSLFDGLTDRESVNSMIQASINLQNANTQLVDKLNLTADSAAETAKQTGLAGQALAEYVNKLAQFATSFQTPAQQLLTAREGLTKAFQSTLGEVVTTSYQEQVARQVQTGTQQVSGGTSQFSSMRTGTSLINFKPQFDAIYTTVYDTVTKTVDRVVLSLKALPQNLTEFDALLKGIDKTSVAGQNMFNTLFAMRDQFAVFIQAMDGIKKGVADTIFGLETPQEQMRQNQARLREEFARFNLAVPQSAQQLIAIGKGIDYTTEAGLDLAIAFPTLVQAFEAVNGEALQLSQTLNKLDISSFTKFSDFVIAQSYVNAGQDIPAANMPSYAVGTSYVPQTGVAMLHQGEAVLTKSENSSITMNSGKMVSLLQSLVTKVGTLEYNMQRTADGVQRTAKELEDITSGDAVLSTEAA